MKTKPIDLGPQGFADLLCRNVPLMDTRSPGEFAKGSFPMAVNLPLMTDQERAKIGSCYKQQGQQAAIELGHKLVSGEIKAQRIAAWTDFATANPEGYLFCWRGGLRSQIVQQWLAEEGIDYPRIQGGYKALRQFVLQQTERLVADTPLLLIAGRTGSGKTQLINQLNNSLDLEGLAHHRGSSFGQRPAGQPSQISFENSLAIDWLKMSRHRPKRVVLEDEGSFIGRCSLPLPLFDKMKQSPRVWLEEPFEQRVETILQDYIIHLEQEYVDYCGEQGHQKFADNLRQGLRRLYRRLGDENYRRIARMMENALAQQQRQDILNGHRQWISVLLSEYYDPAYDYQQNKHPQQFAFRGNAGQIKEWLAEQQ